VLRNGQREMLTTSVASCNVARWCDGRVPPAPLICQFSSLGSLSEAYLADELFATMFASPRAGAPQASSAPTALSQLKSLPPPSSTAIGPACFILPSVEQVRQSNDGYAGGGSIPVPSKNLKPFLRKFRGVRCRIHRW